MLSGLVIQSLENANLEMRVRNLEVRTNVPSLEGPFLATVCIKVAPVFCLTLSLIAKHLIIDDR